MAAQTTYQRLTDRAVHGTPEYRAPRETISRAAEGAAVAYGVVVSLGTDGNTQAVVGGAGAGIGITLRELTREGAINTSVIQYQEDDTMSIIRKGDVNITIPAGGTIGDAVKYNDTTGVLDAGAPGGGESALTGAELAYTVAAGEVGIIRLDGTTPFTP